MIYTKETILHLASLIKGNAESRVWLQKNNFPELILLHYSLEGNEAALTELAKNNHIELTAFVQAIQDDKRAFNWLAKNKKFILAATVRTTYKDPKAEAWLIHHKLSHYVELAKAIKKNEENEAADNVFGLFKKFIHSLRNSYRRRKK